MHIAVVSLGAFGHVNPTLSFVTELVNRGVRVTYFSTENFRNIIEPTGAKFVAMKSWMAENDKHNEDKKDDDKGGQEENVAAVVPFLFLNEAGAYIDDILAVLKEDKPDAILHDFAGIAGTMAADVLGVPNIMLYTSYPSNDTYSVAESFSGIPADHPLRIAADQIAEGYVKKYGCRKMTVKEIFDGHGDLNLVMMQKRLVPNYETFDDSFVFTGVQIGERKAFGTWKAPDNGRPLLYSSLGTAFNNWPEYYPILFDAVRDLDINVFAALGAIDPASLKDIPENVEVGQMVPQLDILSQASVFITHAGMGGTGEAIYYGVPMIAIPQMDEQAITAGVIEKNGLGVAFLDKNQITSESLKAAIKKLLEDPSYRNTAKEFSEDMKSLGGAKATADAIIKFLEK
ncbi:MAG: hypothetical protein IJV14_09670 [Lachnospiraceae bacterium]|nr:hypothetical protein [Lachnospiraceae bacterium]